MSQWLVRVSPHHLGVAGSDAGARPEPWVKFARSSLEAHFPDWRLGPVPASSAVAPGSTGAEHIFQ